MAAIMKAERLEPRMLLAAITAYDVIGLPAEQRNFGFKGDGQNVAIIDTGIDLAAPYYRGGFNFVNPSIPPIDDNGHGSFVADEIHTVAPNAGIYGLEALDHAGVGFLFNVDAALEWVISNYRKDNITVVNMSLGVAGLSSDSQTDTDINQLVKDGVSVVVAAGNDNGTNPLVLDYPAILPSVISVGATYVESYYAVSYVGSKDFTTYQDKICSFSERSSGLSLLAPGAFLTNSAGNRTMAGTSMAAPLVAGSVVIVHQALSSQSKPTDEQSILKVLQETGYQVEDVETGEDNVKHSGLSFARISLDSAIASIMPKPPKPPNPTDTTFVESLYEHVLHRNAEPEGLSYWVSRLNAGASRFSVASSIWMSQEHALQMIAHESVEQLYETLLDRPGDQAGIAYFQDKSEDVTAEIILSSDEFFAKSGND